MTVYFDYDFTVKEHIEDLPMFSLNHCELLTFFRQIHILIWDRILKTGLKLIVICTLQSKRFQFNLSREW